MKTFPWWLPIAIALGVCTYLFVRGIYNNESLRPPSLTPAASAGLVTSPPPAPPPAPPCIQEACAERPVRLRCSSPLVGNNSCAVYLVDYERHCDCVAWGPAKKETSP